MRGQERSRPWKYGREGQENPAGRALAVICDVTEEDESCDHGQGNGKDFGRLDIIFDDAAFPTIPTIFPNLCMNILRNGGTALSPWTSRGLFYCNREALKVMVTPKKREDHRDVASIWGLTGSSAVDTSPAFASPRARWWNLTRELGLEYAPFGINVNALCPGFLL